MGSTFRIFIIYLSFYCSALSAIGTQFLTFPENAYDLAMGSHVSFGGSASVNPALIEAAQSSPSLYFNSGQWYGDIRMSGVSYVHKVGNYNNKFFLRQAGVTDLEYRDDRPSDDPSTTFAAYGFSIGSGLSYKASIGQIGATISALYFTIYDQHSTGVSIDLGYSNVFNNGWGIGASLLNIGTASKFYQEKPKLPTRILAGVSKDLVLNNIKNKFHITSEFLSLNDAWKIKIGNYAQWKQIRILGGFSTTKHSTSLSIGSGFVYGRFGVTYAIRFGSQDIGVPQNFSISFRLP